MSEIKRLYVTGYRDFELNIFKEDDAKIAIIKKVLKNRLVNYLEQGLEWVLVAGNLGTEYWAAEVVNELKSNYSTLQIATIYPFENFGEQWGEKNQMKRAYFKEKTDFVTATSHHPYKNPAQLRAHTQFILSHTDGSLLLYDEEFPGKSGYFSEDAHKFSENKAYILEYITVDDLQNSIDYEE